MAEKYPTFEALAAAPEADVAATWRPLGYNIRPRRLHAIARESVERYGGELPGDEATLRSFKGIGGYTAGAVLSFAFGQRAAILDTNVARVLFRMFVGSGNPKSHAMRRLWEVSRTALPMRHVFDFNQALMDFGAVVSHRAKARLPAVPAGGSVQSVSVHCRRAGPPDITQPAAPGNPVTPPTVIVVAAVVEVEGRFLLTRRQPGTHLEGCWEFPGGKRHDGETLEQALAREIREELGARILAASEVFSTSHDYPERTVELHFFTCRLEERLARFSARRSAGCGAKLSRRCSSRPPMRSSSPDWPRDTDAQRAERGVGDPASERASWGEGPHDQESAER